MTRFTGPLDTSSCLHAKWHTLSQNRTTLNTGFWKHRQEVNRTTAIPHGRSMLEKFGNFHDLKLAAGLIDGKFIGPHYIDSDLYKWLESASLELGNAPDPALSAMVDEVIALLEQAQRPDGYLNTYYQVVEPQKRWQDMTSGHELYCAGHLFQAAAAHARATGSHRLLNIATRFADCIDQAFGPGKIESTCGHPEIETALVELSRITGLAKYLKLAEFFINQRGYGRIRTVGWPPSLNERLQDHVPVRDAQTLAGHAVRQLYLLAGLADVFLHTGEPALMDAQMRLWNDLTQKKMYITGGVGSVPQTEGFGPAYDLPLEHGYCETCAGIASVFWNWRLLIATGQAKFADEMERVLFNAFLSGVSLDGQRYFYENPLLCRSGKERTQWHACACCPPNVTRVLASIQQFTATHDAKGIQVHQFMPCTLDSPKGVLKIQTQYPFHGSIQATVASTTGGEWEISFRVPAWAHQATLSINGEPSQSAAPGTYATVKRQWNPGDTLSLELPMPARLTQAHPHIDSTTGCVAIQRGPIVYCIEQADNPTPVFDLALNPESPLSSQWNPDLLGGIQVVYASGIKRETASWQGRLYRAYQPTSGTPEPITAIPYFAWANRTPGAMRVWVPLASPT